MRCQSCAARTPPGYSFCLGCGARVRKEPFWPRSPESLWQRAYCLVRMADRASDQDVGTGYPLDVLRRGSLALTIGSDADCEIVLDHPSVEPRHAWLIRHGDGFVIEDADTDAGTFVNDRQAKRPRRLKLRDIVRVGECRLVYALSDQLCPHCLTPDTLVPLDDISVSRQDGATGLAAPTHACHRCGREYWIVTSRREGWRRRAQWIAQTGRNWLADRVGKGRHPE